eukprot:5522634-Amphidinium_carterae.1
MKCSMCFHWALEGNKVPPTAEGACYALLHNIKTQDCHVQNELVITKRVKLSAPKLGLRIYVLFCKEFCNFLRPTADHKRGLSQKNII